jgi:hypothetical protein
VYVNFLTTFFLLLPPIFPPAPPAGGGGAVRGVLGAPSLLARAPGGARCPLPPGSATAISIVDGSKRVFRRQEVPFGGLVEI